MEETSVPEEKPAYAFPVFDVDSPVRQISVANELHRCLFCKRSEVDELHIGPLYSLPEDKVTVHYYCMLFSAGLEQHGDDREGILGFMPEDIFKEVRRASRLKCLYCGISGASIGCNTSRCKASFHFPCGLANDANFQFVKNYQSYCKNHRQCADFKVPDDHNCPICYNPIENQRPIRGTCCKTAIFHKDCIQKQALSSGYFFKCPTCNSLENFHYETKVQGIYVPEQDASWEREPDAFQELYQQYEHCDSDRCECPKGRNFGANKGSWLLARCRVCGSAGTHRQCGKLTTIANWACTSCLDFEARCDAKNISDESIVKAPEVLVVTTRVPSQPSENGSPSPPTTIEKRKRIRTGRQPPKRVRKKPQFKAPPPPPPPAKTARAKKEKPIATAPEPKKTTEVKKSRKRKTESIIQVKRTYKRRKRNDLTPEDIEWLETQEEETSVDLSKIHIGSACGDFFPYNKKVKKDFAMRGLDCFPDWRGYSLQVQVVNVFLDLVDPVLPEDSKPKTEVKVAKPVLTDAVTQKNISKAVKPVLADTANKKNRRKVLKPDPIDTAFKKTGRKGMKPDPTDMPPKKSGRKVVKSVLTDIIPKKTERNVAKAVTSDTIPKLNERKVAKPIPAAVVPKKSERKVAKPIPTDIVPKKNARKAAKPIATGVAPQKSERDVAGSVPTATTTTPIGSHSAEKLHSINSTKSVNTPIKTPKKRGRRRKSKWMRGVVKKKKNTSAKAKAPVKSIDTSLNAVDKKSDKDKPASASKAILEGIRRSHESLLQFQQGKSTIKSTDEQVAPSDRKPKPNGGTTKIDDTVLERGGTRRRPSQRGSVSETGNEGKPNESGAKNAIKNGSSKSESNIPNDRSSTSTNDIPTTTNEKNTESSSSSSLSDNRHLAQTNGTFQRRASGTRSCDKPVVKVEVDDANNQRHSDGDNMDTSDSANGRPNLAEELQNSARGIARDLMQHPNRSEAHEKLRVLEQRCPQLFQKKK